MPIRPGSIRLVLLYVAFAIHGPEAVASGAPEDSPLYQNFLEASAVLDSAAATHGGRALIDRSTNLRFTYTGHFLLEGHFARPWAQRDYPCTGSVTYSEELRALHSEVTYTYEKPIPAFTIVGPANGLMLDGGATQPDTIPDSMLATRIREELEIFPQEYLRQAREASASLRLLPGSSEFDVLCYTLDNGQSRALYFEGDTHLLVRVERIDHWQHKGDRLEWRTFGDYFEQDGMKLPRQSEVHVEESSHQYNVQTSLVTFESGAHVKPDEFRIPEAYKAGFENWALQAPPPDSTHEPLPVHDLGKGVYIIDLPPSDSRSLLVAYSDFSVILEAGDRSELSARILATADRLLPDKPVRYVAMSHHHPLYTGGLRPYAQRGVTILATPGDTAYYRDLCTRPHRIHPDLQQSDMRPPRFEVIDGVRVIKDRAQRLELHMFD